MLQIPILTQLERIDDLMIAGAGGGFDIFCGLPIYFALRAAGKRVHLGNLSFSNTDGVAGFRPTLEVLEVTAASDSPYEYFPERHLCRWFESHGECVSIYTFKKTGVVPLSKAWRAVADHLGLGAIILVDGGTDSLMRGDEAGLGTPVEDVASLAAVHACPVETKLLMCIGFGVDAFHGVCHAQFLEAVAELTASGAFLGSFSITKGMPEVDRYIEAVEAVTAAMPSRPSIVNTSVISAAEGHFGDYHRTFRTQGSKLWINPLMSLYWAFQLGPVVERIQYLELIQNSQTPAEMTLLIEGFRKGQTSRKAWEPIPC